jgi:hypothetical protein
MGVTIVYGPDGGVFVSDWSDTGECHSVRNTQRDTGRIYKITYGTPAPAPGDVAGLSDHELVQLQLHRNDWYVRHARRVLQQRAGSGDDMTAVHHELRAVFDDQADIPRKLRLLWALHVTGGLDDPFLISLLHHDREYLQDWAIRLLCEGGDPPEAARRIFRELAANGESPFVRLHLASALQRLPRDHRWPIAEALVARGEDAADVNLPLMIWYGLEPLVHDDLPRFVALAKTAQIPLIRKHIARRAALLSP